MKKHVIFLFVLLISAFFVIGAAAQGPDSSEIEIASAYQNGIIPDALVGQNLTKGLTHAELAALAYRLSDRFEHQMNISAVTPFSDIEGHPLQSEIEKAYGLGLLSDVEGDRFLPDTLVSRQRTALILCRVIKARLYKDWSYATDDQYFLSYNMQSRFLDDRDIAVNAVDSVYFLSSNKLMEGMSNALFCPEDVISRAAAIIAANRIYLTYANIPDNTGNSAGSTESTYSGMPQAVNTFTQTGGQPDQPANIYSLMGHKFSYDSNHYALVKADGSLWTWGQDYLGNGTKEGSQVPVHIMDNVANVYIVDKTGLALKTDGTLWAWGQNSYFTVGNGQDGGEQLTPVRILDNVVKASLGYHTGGAVTADGGLYLWGYNSDGNLGFDKKPWSSVDRYLTPTRVMEGIADVSCNPGNYGAYTMILKQDGSLWTFGSNSYGQLGSGATDLSQVYRELPDGGSSGSPAYEWVPSVIMDNVSSIYAGDRMAAAIKADGSLWTWGWNESGRLGNGGAANAAAGKEAPGGSYPADCQTVPMKIMDNAAAVAIGYYKHASFLKNDGTVWDAGYSRGDVPVQVRISGVTAIAGRDGETWAIQADGTIWRWSGDWNPEPVKDLTY